MNFEKDLIYELEQIPGMTNKVSMLTAQSGTDKPFIACAKEKIDFIRIISGQRVNTEAVYQVHVVANSYAESQDLLDKVVDKLLSFRDRYIGQSPTGILDSKVQILPDEYILEVDAFESTVRLTATF